YFAHAPTVVREVMRRHAGQLPRKVLQTWSEHGLKGLLARASDLFRHERPITQFYAAWTQQFDTVTEHMRQDMRSDVAAWAQRPLISIIMPVYDTDLRWLDAAIRSVQGQIYPNWELCISDDASTREGLRELLQGFAREDHRIRIAWRSTNANISVN